MSGPTSVMRDVTVRPAIQVNWVSALILSWFGGLALCPETIAGDPHRDSRIVVTGIVTDIDGQVVPDATIYLVYAPVIVYAPRIDDVRTVTTRTDAAGVWAFSLEHSFQGDLVALVAKGGHALGMENKPSRSLFGAQYEPGDTIDIPIQLGRRVRRTLRVVDERGSPIEGARLGVCGVSRADHTPSFYWGEALVPELSWVTAADGTVTIDDLPTSHILRLRIETPQHGAQSIRLDVDKLADEATVTLVPVCRVEIALVLDDTSRLSDREVTIDSRSPREASPSEEALIRQIWPWGGNAFARTDASGKATVVVPAGELRAQVKRLADERQFPADATPVQGQPGQTVSLPIPFKPGMKLTGRVQTPDQEPIANVGLHLSGVDVRSSDDGTFAAWAPADQPVYGRVQDIPDGFSFPFDAQLRSSAPTDATSAVTEREIVPVILRKAVPVSGQVVDETGQPVSGARVTARWVHESERMYTLKSDTATSDAQGRFRLRRVLADVDVSVTAQTLDRSVLEATSVHAEKPQELKLTVTPEGMVSIVGSVQGSDNNDIADAAVKVSQAAQAPNGGNYGSVPMEWNGRGEFPVKSDGSFQSPGKVPRIGKYSVTISAPGYLATETPFLSPPPSGPDLDLGVMRLTRARAAAGIVRDTSGAPVSGVKVWSWAASTDSGRARSSIATATTDQAGRFALDGLHPAAAAAIVEKEGWRRTGFALEEDAGEMTVTLLRVEEATPSEQAVHPVTLANSRRHAAAEKLLNTLLASQRNSNYFYGQIHSMLVRSNPAAAQAELASTTSADLRARTLAQLGEIEDALAEAEGITDPYGRAYCRFGIVDGITDPDEARQILAAALLDAQTIVRPDRRAVVVAGVAERLSQLGDHEQVATILREELPRVEALSRQEWPGFARGFFAAQLARTDPQTALRLASEAKDDERRRHYQNIAHVLAATNPELAEEALRRIGERGSVDSPAVRVAYRMASVDLPRAIRLVEGIDDQQHPVEKARGLGVIAWAIRETEPQRARELLQQAFAAIRGPQDGGSYDSDDGFGAAVELLRYAERIDPQRLTEYFWTAVSFYPGPSAGAWSPDEALPADADRQAQLALLFSLYKVAPKLPSQIMEPVFAYWESHPGTHEIRFTEHQGTFMAMALTDPQRAADWALKFHEELDPERRRYIPQPWEVIGDTLTKDRDAIGESMTRDVFHHWVIDEFDF